MNDMSLSRTALLACMVSVLLLSLTGSVAGEAPSPDFSANVTSGPAPLPVSFTDISAGSPTGSTWFFGDEPWTLQTGNASWPARYGHASVAMPDGGIIVLGGVNGFHTPAIYLNDVWRSTDNGVTWSRMTSSAGWQERWGFDSVAIPDGSIVLMAGWNDRGEWNDVWRSTDKGATWDLVTAGAAWPARHFASSVVLPDGSIVLMGGWEYGAHLNDTWRSTDGGATWTRMTAHAAWGGRYEQSAVAMPDGSIVLMGGFNSFDQPLNDVWRSTDKGASWSLVTADAGWSPRVGSSTFAMPDGSIILAGGETNDVWRSTDNGATWGRLTAGAGWPARGFFSAVEMQDGSIVLTGGLQDSTADNDVWRFTSAMGTSVQHPVHTYTSAGTYDISLTSSNADGRDSVTREALVNVTTPAKTDAGGPGSGKNPMPAHFPPRYAHASVAYDNKMWVIAGATDAGLSNAVWYSADGVSWTEANASAAFPAREGHSAVVYDNKMWVIGGYGNTGLLNDAWYSTDGIYWTEATG
ncbi:MAG TPA: hypothetical protein VLY83_05975 [Methanoregula sp.]|nr:hypothetical protein [Methanoregula sp.]